MRKPQTLKANSIKNMIMQQSSKPIFDHAEEIREICKANGWDRVPNVIYEVFIYGIIWGKRMEREKKKRPAGQQVF